jgi:hypothetical protein
VDGATWNFHWSPVKVAAACRLVVSAPRRDDPTPFEV